MNQQKETNEINKLMNVLGTIDLKMIAERIRNGGGALQDARAVRNTFDAWKPSCKDKPIKNGVVRTRASDSTLNWLKNKFSGSERAIISDTFIVHYNFYGDVSRRNVLGANTVGAETRVQWVNSPVEVVTYTGMSSTTTINSDMQRTLDNSRNLGQLAKCTGLSAKHVKDLPSKDVDKLLSIFSSGSVGQNKFTRIVKGCLMLLDIEEFGKQKIRVSVNCVKYDVASLISHKSHGAAYVWSEYPSNAPYSVFCYLMGCEYPNPYLRSNDNVTVPADGDEVYLVSRVAYATDKQVILSKEVIWSSILQYISDLGCGDIFEECMVVAASLRNNKYFSKVGLPKVVSYVDLIKPSVELLRLGLQSKVLTDNTTMKAIGRMHQMLVFNTVKDAISSARTNTVGNHDILRTLSKYTKGQAERLYNNGNRMTTLKLYQKGAAMKVLEYLDEATMQTLENTSIFESAWLIDSIESVMKGGAIEALKHGTKDRMFGYSKPGVYEDHKGLLSTELRLAGVRFRVDELPEGDWTMDACALTVPPSHEKKFNRRKFKEVSLTDKGHITRPKDNTVRISASAAVATSVISKMEKRHIDTSLYARPVGKPYAVAKQAMVVEDEDTEDLEGMHISEVQDVAFVNEEGDVIEPEPADSSEEIKGTYDGFDRPAKEYESVYGHMLNFGRLDDDGKEMPFKVVLDANMVGIKKSLDWYSNPKGFPDHVITAGRLASAKMEGAEEHLSNQEKVIIFASKYNGPFDETIHHLIRSSNLKNNPKYLQYVGLESSEDWRIDIVGEYLGAGGTIEGWKTLRGVLGRTPLTPIDGNPLRITTARLVGREKKLSKMWCSSKGSFRRRERTSMSKMHDFQDKDALVLFITSLTGEVCCNIETHKDLMDTFFVQDRGILLQIKNAEAAYYDENATEVHKKIKETRAKGVDYSKSWRK